MTLITLLHRDQFIGTRADSDLLTMLQRLFPSYIWIAVHKVIMMMLKCRICQMFSQLAVPNRICFLTEIDTSLIQCNRIKRSQHSKIRKNRRIILTMAIAVRRNICDQADMETRASVYNSLRIFCNLTSQN